MSTRERTDYIVVHCSASAPGADIGVEEIDAMHRARVPPFDSCGYHAVIRLDGRIEYGRPFDAVGAHVYGYNRVSVGVCLVGGLDNAGNAQNTYREAQINSLTVLIEVLARSYPGAEVLGHRDLSPDIDGDGIVEAWEWLKECPCFDVREWWK